MMPPFPHYHAGEPGSNYPRVPHVYTCLSGKGRRGREKEEEEEEEEE